MRIEVLLILIFLVSLQIGCTVAERTTKVVLTAGKSARKTTCEITVSQKRHWKLVWEDNFDKDGNVDPSKWTLVTKGTPDWKKYMTASIDYAFVKDGKLILKAVKHADGYHTGGVESSKKFSFKYGKVEVKAKLGSGQGTWPAIWMMPEKEVFGGWPGSGEIDIMEHLNNDANIYQVIHSHYVDNLGITTDPPNSHTPPFSVGQFNTFGVEWFPEKIDFLVNGDITFSYPKKVGLPADMLQWPFDEHFYLILNQALGGSWVGKIEDSILPVQTEIDYVKVYGLSDY